MKTSCSIQTHAFIKAAIVGVLSLAVCAGIAPGSQAVTFKMSGVVTEVHDAVSVFPDSIVVGSSYAATLVYALPFRGHMYYEVVLGGVWRMVSDDGILWVINDGPEGDKLDFRSENRNFYLDFLLTDPTGTALSSAGLPSVLDASAWGSREWVVQLSGTGGPSEPYYTLVRGTITAITSVPDSSNTLALLALLVLPLLGAARRSAQARL